jgi:hypothetical protein
MLALSWRAWSAKLTPALSKADWAGYPGSICSTFGVKGNRVARQETASPKEKPARGRLLSENVWSAAAPTNDSQPGERETYQRQ